MPIRGLESRELFKTRKSEYFFPAQAITDVHRLRGRNKELRNVEKALSSPGRQCFIFGERGVGKTSLAKTAYRENFPEVSDILLVGCEETSSFSSILRALIEKGIQEAPNKQSSGWKARFSFKTGIMNTEIERSISEGKVPDITDVNHAIHVLSYLRKSGRLPPAAIIDEFDRIISDAQRTRFADFLKQASDQELDLKLIFCGIAQDIESLIGSHLSVGRYIAPIELGRLHLNELWEIIEGPCDECGIRINKEYLIRSSQIADGYPYFMHLLGDCLFWSLNNAHYETAEVRYENFDEAVREAVSDAEPILKDAYDKATKKYDKIYEEVLWAVAAGSHLERKWQDTYEIYRSDIASLQSYRQQIGRDTFYKRMLALTKPEFGEILQTNKNGWYSFSENVVRSYVRLRAVEGGMSLAPDMHRVPD